MKNSTETKGEVETQENWVDDTFRVEKSRWGTWSSFDKEGNQLVASLTEEICIDATRFYLKGKQDGFPEAGTSYDSFVGGKL